jgi:hypothetical protein
MFLKLYNSHRTTFGCNGDGWRYEEISILSFFLPMLEWGKLVIHKSFDVKVFDIFLTFVIRLFYIVKWGQYLKNGLTYTTNMVFVSWSHEEINLLFLVICFVTLWSSTFGCSCGTSKICLLDVLANHLLGDGPPFDFVTLGLGFFDAPFCHCLL